MSAPISGVSPITMANQTEPITLSASPVGIADVLVSKFHGNYEIIGATVFLLWLSMQLLPARNKLPIMNKKKWYELSW